MRDPTRDGCLPHNRTAAKTIVDALGPTPTIAGVLADQVHIELGKHAGGIEAEAIQAISKMREKLKRLDEINDAYAGQGSTTFAHFDDHMKRARDLYDRWLRGSVTAGQSAEAGARAISRVNKTMPPAQKGKNSLGDCLVVETYLEAAVKLRVAGLQSRFVFISSNTEDFLDTSRKLHANLRDEFDVVGLEYAPNFGAAKHLLGI